MRDNDLILCIGPAGTGKTYLAVGMAVTLLRQALVKRIVLVRPAVEAGERLGFLPGDIVAKINPYLRPLFDALNDMMEPEQVKRYMENDIIEIVPLAFMRGRTLNNAVIILDEGQNTTVPQMKMFLTRMGNGSKIIVTGDVTQVDLPRQTRSGLIDAVHRLRDLERIAIVYLDEHDIVRHPLVQQIVRAYEDDKPRKEKGVTSDKRTDQSASKLNPCLRYVRSAKSIRAWANGMAGGVRRAATSRCCRSLRQRPVLLRLAVGLADGRGRHGAGLLVGPAVALSRRRGLSVRPAGPRRFRGRQPRRAGQPRSRRASRPTKTCRTAARSSRNIPRGMLLVPRGQPITDRQLDLLQARARAPICTANARPPTTCAAAVVAVPGLQPAGRRWSSSTSSASRPAWPRACR